METTTLIRRNWLQLLILAAPFAVIAAVWHSVPQRIAFHWNLAGRPNGWADKSIGLILIPLLNVAIAALLASVPRLDPKLRRDAAASEPVAGALRVARFVITALLSFISILIAAAALGYAFNVTRLTIVAVLVFLVVLGNFLGTLRPNYFIGIRNPWTLENPEVWRATHRIGGRIFVFGSLGLLAVQFFLTPSQLTIGFVIFLGLTVVWSLLYAYRLSRDTVAHGS